ncbi:MAG TPA: GNAT family protein [Anaerolineaceae bacterium]|nr:GNAT family protein [Anaerolineaceae bacterium]
MIVIRPIEEKDAGLMLRLKNVLDRETRFMMLEPGERTAEVEDERRRIRELLARDNSLTWVAEARHELVGYLEASGGEFQRNWHSATLVIGILGAWSGQGIGQRLFSALLDWAKERGLHRLELTVMVSNERAVHLYQKMGFTIEGVRHDSLRVDGQFVDEYAMSLMV